MFIYDYTTYSQNDTEELGRRFSVALEPGTEVAMYGGLGAGKTAFTRGVLRGLGYEGTVSSPTFAIVNEYSSPLTVNQLPLSSIYHFDFYRIKKLEEVYDMGYEDYFYSGSLCFIEWPELIEPLLPDDAVRVTIAEQPDGTRTVCL